MSDTATTVEVAEALEAATAPLSTTAKESREAASKLEDAWLAAHDDQDDGETAKPEAAPEKKAAPEKAKDEQPEADQPKEDKAEDAGQVKATAAEYESALAALRRDRVPAAVLAKMSKEDVLAYGQVRLSHQSDVDKAFAELKSFRDKQATAKTIEAQPTQSPASVDLKAHVKAVAEKLGLDDSEAPVLEKFGQAIAEAATKGISDLRQQNEQLSMSVLRMEVEHARERLGERFPGLKDDAKFKAVLAKADTIDPDLPVSQRLADAAAIVFFDEHAAKSEPKSNRTDTPRDRLNGQFTTQTRQTPAKAKSLSERESDALDALESGKGLEAAKRAYAG